MKYEIEELLTNIGAFLVKNSIQFNAKPFNPLLALRSKEDEVNLHTRLLHYLINPLSDFEDQKYLILSFLKLFDFECEVIKNLKVLREYKNIDLLVVYGKRALIIENKIYAKDQYRQLKRYREIIESEGKDVIQISYLTLYGMEPDERSYEDILLKEIRLVSYREDIFNWLKDNISSTRNTGLKETLHQYLQIVKILTHQTMEERDQQEIAYKVVALGKVEEAAAIVSSWNTLRVQTEIEFWKELEDRFSKDDFLRSKNIKIIDRQKYDEDKIRRSNRIRKKDSYYGIMINFLGVENGNLCWYIEQTPDQGIKYGYSILSNKVFNPDNNEYTRRVNNLQEYDFIIHKLSDLLIPNSTDEWWIGRVNLGFDIDFMSFTSEGTYKLAYADYRSKIIEQICEESIVKMKTAEEIIGGKN